MAAAPASKPPMPFLNINNPTPHLCIVLIFFVSFRDGRCMFTLAQEAATTPKCRQMYPDNLEASPGYFRSNAI